MARPVDVKRLPWLLWICWWRPYLILKYYYVRWRGRRWAGRHWHG